METLRGLRLYAVLAIALGLLVLELLAGDALEAVTLGAAGAIALLVAWVVFDPAPAVGLEPKKPT